MPQATKPHSRSEGEISKTIVETIAEAEEVAPTELEACLYDVINPDALNDLFQHHEDEPTTEGRVTFRFNGYTITVQSDLSIEIN